MPPCTLILNERSASHDLKGHPESEVRIDQVCPYLRKQGAGTIHASEAAMEDLLRVHRPEYLARLADLSARCRPGGVAYLDSDTYVTGGSWAAARSAAGAAIRAAGEALEGRPAFAIVRPPGHHAGPAYGMGFCLLNNAAIAAAWALCRVDRVAIIDWDVHHGNGTQALFYESDRVLYCSIHRSPFYPGTGGREETGTGPGEGYTVNIPLPPGSGLREYREAFVRDIIPAAVDFEPGMIIVSAGQDTLSDDPLGGMNLEPPDFGLFTTLLSAIGTTPPAFVLEGGYGPSHGEAISEIVRVLDAWG